MSPLDHVTLTAAQFPDSLSFYDAALGALGLVRLDELVDEEEEDPAVEVAAWGRPEETAVLWLAAGAPATTGVHLRFRADSPVQVETFYRVALQAGGGPRSAPRRWAIYRPGEFNAIVTDPAGNLVEAASGE